MNYISKIARVLWDLSKLDRSAITYRSAQFYGAATIKLANAVKYK
jgi:hypothetical protein